MRPLVNPDAVLKNRYKTVKYRPFPDSGLRNMGQWIQKQSWKEIYSIDCPNLKAEKFEEIIMCKVNEFFPEKIIKINDNDKPWVDKKLISLDRARKREYNKKKKSQKWHELNQSFLLI